MAHKKAGGSASTNRDSVSKRLGVKLYGGEKAAIGNILIRQKGNKFYAGKGTKQGNDFTIYAAISGKVKFLTRLGKRVVQIDG
ncbi:50S ribosomal protein L27 [Candidatus Daviesbacteria bacterium RIFOXYD1_FULL_41_10]|uniref:Large ribosomal subunit protein bL27 n=2 Tax=Candidatus Daviesiibacteriota TaxID=1752718 RepID=A0A1F5N0H0_9BACT|nr:MAG: 50S ribosomal protein L27 [Candidatus Daviesbacteria bacterium GW2011_GWB1_41_5]OGE71115.1 MAG: 50S ribosomal protein L27 [Candidatus Daviesbacteria bacterium RIFOXYD1_FULL_41_10]